MDTDKESPDGVILGTRNNLKALISDTISYLEKAEKSTVKFNKANDTINQNITKVDKLIRELDGVSNGVEGKYKKVLEKRVKQRLDCLKSLFSTYNKIGKNMYEVVLETADANAAYAILSMKYFG